MYSKLNELLGLQVEHEDNETIRNAIANCGLLVVQEVNTGICKVDNAKWALLGPDAHVKVVEVLQYSQDLNDAAHTNPLLKVSVVPVDEKAADPVVPEDVPKNTE